MKSRGDRQASVFAERQRREQHCYDVRQYLRGGREHHEEDVGLSRERAHQPCTDLVTVLIMTFSTYAQGRTVAWALGPRTSCEPVGRRLARAVLPRI